MRNNRFSNLNLPAKADVAVALLLPMMTGFLCSRAIHSVSIILFALNALRGLRLRPALHERWWMAALPCLLLLAVSYWWSPDKGLWDAHVQVKIPVLILPFSFALLPGFTEKQWRWLLLILISFLVAGSAWSLSFLIRDPQQYLEGYKVSHLLPTPAYNDHIAYSMAVALAIVLLVQHRGSIAGRGWKAAAALAALFLIAYLHILAAKSGLLAFYLFVGLYTFYSLLRRKWLRAGLIVIAMGAGAFAALRAFPTLKTRIDYIAYTFQLWREGRRDVNYSDMGRTISYDVAADRIQRQPWTGYGAGGMEGAMREGYRALRPEVPDENHLLPHNQYLLMALAGGLPCLLLFTVWTLWPLVWLRRSRDSFYLLAAWLMLLVPLLTDPFLEMQFGVFVYLMFLLWQRQAQKPPLIAAVREQPTP